MKTQKMNVRDYWNQWSAWIRKICFGEMDKVVKQRTPPPSGRNENPDEVLQQVINTIKDNIRPDLAQFYQAYVEDRDGKNIVRVEIQRGTSRPYYLSGKGVRPEGVYVRKGSETVQASDNEILELIKTTSGNDYEKNRSFVQDLTFCEAQDFFKSRNKVFIEFIYKQVFNAVKPVIIVFCKIFKVLRMGNVRVGVSFQVPFNRLDSRIQIINKTLF